MNIADIPNDRYDDFYEYIKSAIEATDIERKTTMHVSPQAEAFFEHIKMCCEDISKTVALIIHSPECFERTGTITQLAMIISFWNSLSNLLCAHSNIKVICSTTAAVINQLANSDDFPSFARFDVCPPSEKILGAYVGKWVSLNYNYSEKSRERKINELLSALKNNAIVYQYVMTSPQAIMIFLTATKLDNQKTKYGSQTHYLKIISKAATAAVVQKTNFDKYSFIVPLSFIAAICCERSSYTFDRNDLRYVFSRDNSHFKNMTAFISTKQFDEINEEESLDNYVEEYISALTNFPFVNVKSHTYTFSPIWRNYYCANAIAWGLIGDPSVSHVERFATFIDEQMKRIRDDTNKSDALATDWVSIIAMAAKLSRQNAESIVPILEKYTGDISPSHRRGREVAVVILLKMLRNRCFVNDDVRHQIMHSSLGFFLYHKQLDDINAIIASSPYKEETVSHIFGDFHESIVKEMPIPVFNFTIGFLVFNYVNISKWTYQVDDSRNQNGVVGSVCNEVLTNAKNSKEFFISNIENAATVFKKFFSNWNLERQIMFTLALNDFTWLSFANSIKIGEYQPRIKERKYDWDINKYFRILLSLISNEHYQISSTALYACSHIIAAERWGNLKTNIMDSLTSKLTDIVIADYKAREIYDMNSQASNGTEKGIFELQPYCGALRVMVLLEPEIEQIAKCKKS